MYDKKDFVALLIPVTENIYIMVVAIYLVQATAIYQINWNTQPYAFAKIVA